MLNKSYFKWVKLAIASIIYILWVVWIGNYWFLLGYPLVFDNYVTKKIPWGFWKKRKDGKKPSAIVEWIDAIVFALVAVYIINIFLFQNYKIPTSSLEKSLLVGDYLFVSKASYGPRMPNTPIAFPLVQNTFSSTTNIKSYLDWPHWDYKRLKGITNIKHNDIVVFNFPAGDTVPFKSNNPDFYNQALIYGIQEASNNQNLMPTKPFDSDYERNHYFMNIGRKRIYNNPETFGDVLYRPVDKRDNYVKRCIALPGDVFEVRHNQVYINDKAVENPEGLQHNYIIKTDGTILNDRFYERMGVSNADRGGRMGNDFYVPLTKDKADLVKDMPFVQSITIDEEMPNNSGLQVFPYSSDYNWSRDNFGPLTMPAKGTTIDLTITNLPIYERIITAYEGNKLKVKDGQIFINEKPATNYTFKMDYYFMLGDNRHNSLDSRSWGFVPEDHIVGKPILVWLSLDKDKSFPANIRWDRIFKLVHKD
nr:signal peptidase I [uncultured Carboxylicivirga sp.]